MKILIVGAGRQGRGALADLALSERVDEVGIFDVSADRLDEAVQFALSARSDGATLRALSEGELEEALRWADAILCAAPYTANLHYTRLAIQAGTPFCDLGGDPATVQQQLALNDQARERGVTIVPDCGLAPGLVDVLAYDAVQVLDPAERVHMRVGGLPRNPKPPLNYALSWSAEGLINEYSKPCLAIRDGKRVSLEPLEDLETIEFPEPYGAMEAFNTAGGSSTLPLTLEGRVKDLTYKTIRYPGHCEVMRVLRSLGLFDETPRAVGTGEVVPRQLTARLLKEALPSLEGDVVLLRVDAEGSADGSPSRIRYELIEEGDERFSAMMKTTGFPASIIAQGLADGTIHRPGVQGPEACVPAGLLIEELAKRGIQVRRVVERP